MGGQIALPDSDFNCVLIATDLAVIYEFPRPPSAASGSSSTHFGSTVFHAVTYTGAVGRDFHFRDL